MSANSRLKANKIIGQRKAFYRQRIPEPSCARKETVDIDILVTSQLGEWWQKNYAIYQKNEETSLENTEMEPVDPAQMNIYQINNFKKDLSWLHFDDEPRVQERQQMKDQQPRHDNSISCMSVW